MTRLVYVVEWHNQEPVKLHVVAVPNFSEPGFYRQTGSMNAFRRNIHALGSKMITSRQPGTRFHVRWAEEFAMDLESEARNAALLKTYGKTSRHDTTKLPRADYASVKHFYAAIGYDTKKRKCA